MIWKYSGGAHFLHGRLVNGAGVDERSINVGAYFQCRPTVFATLLRSNEKSAPLMRAWSFSLTPFCSAFSRGGITSSRDRHRRPSVLIHRHFEHCDESLYKEKRKIRPDQGEGLRQA